VIFASADGAGNFLQMRYYNDAAPTALGQGGLGSGEGDRFLMARQEGRREIVSPSWNRFGKLAGRQTVWERARKPPLVLAILPRFTPRVGGGSAF